jgi:hypothetical protein
MMRNNTRKQEKNLHISSSSLHYSLPHKKSTSLIIEEIQTEGNKDRNLESVASNSNNFKNPSFSSLPSVKNQKSPKIT